MKLLMYGAGSIGRGFIGPLFSASGYEVVFVDIDERIIGALNERREYSYTVVSGNPYDVPVKNVRGVNGLDEDAVLNEIADCDIMATSLGSAVLKRVAPLIAKGFSRRMRQSGKPLDILICENLKDASHLLREWMRPGLSDGDDQLFNDKCGLVEAAIGRMVPVAQSRSGDSGDPLRVAVEAYGFLPVDAAAFAGDTVKADGLIAYSPFAFYEERKLYLHNMGHAVCAYLGMRKGFSTIAEAISDAEILVAVQSAMTESAAMLSIKYDIPFTRIFDHAEDLLLRFGNLALGDTCERVGRDPMRKLCAGDRLAGAIQSCVQYEVYPAYIALGFAAALRHVTDSEQQAETIARETAKLDAEQSALVMQIYGLLEENRPLSDILQNVRKIKAGLRGVIV